MVLAGAFNTRCKREDQAEDDSSKDPFFNPSSAHLLTISRCATVHRGCGIDCGVAPGLNLSVMGSVLKGFGKEFS